MIIIKIIAGILTSIISTIIGIGLFWYVKESWKKGYIISGFIPTAIYHDRSTRKSLSIIKNQQCQKNEQ